MGVVAGVAKHNASWNRPSVTVREHLVWIQPNTSRSARSFCNKRRLVSAETISIERKCQFGHGML